MYWPQARYLKPFHLAQANTFGTVLTIWRGRTMSQWQRFITYGVAHKLATALNRTYQPKHFWSSRTTDIDLAGEHYEVLIPTVEQLDGSPLATYTYGIHPEHLHHTLDNLTVTDRYLIMEQLRKEALPKPQLPLQYIAAVTMRDLSRFALRYDLAHDDLHHARSIVGMS